MPNPFLLHMNSFNSNNSIEHKYSLALFNPLIRPYQVLPLQARVDQGAKAMKEYSSFPIAPALLESYHQIF